MERTGDPLVGFDERCNPEGLVGQIRRLQPGQRLSGHGRGKEVVEAAGRRSKGVVAVLVRIAPLVQELDLQAFGRDIAAQLPEVAQRPVGVVVSPVGIAVFEEDVAVFVEQMVAAAPRGRGVKVEEHLAVRLLLDPVEEAPQIGFGPFGGDRQAVDLEDPDAVAAVEVEQRRGILFPVGEVVLHARIEPQPHLDTQFAGPFDHGIEPPRVLVSCRLPVVGVLPDVAERPAGQRRIGALALLPTVVDLEMGDPQPGGALDLLQAEAFVDLRILAAVAPSVHHHHLVAAVARGTDLLLVTPQGGQGRQFALAVDARHHAVGPHPLVREIPRRHADARHGERSEIGREVTAPVGQLHGRTGGLLQEEEAPAVDAVADEEQVAAIAVLAVGDDVTLPDQVVVPVRHVGELHGPRMPVHAGKVHPVEDRLGGFHRHVGLRLDVLAVGGIGRFGRGLQHGGRSGPGGIREPQPRLAGDGRYIPVDAVFAPDLDAVERILHPGAQIRRGDGRGRDRPDRQRSPGTRCRSVARKDEIGLRPHRAEQRSRGPVLERKGHQIAAVPAETALHRGVAEHQHRIPLQEGIGVRTVDTRLRPGSPGRRGRRSRQPRRGQKHKKRRQSGAENHRLSVHRANYRWPAIPAGWSRIRFGRLKFWLFNGASWRQAPRDMASCSSFRWS